MDPETAQASREHVLALLTLLPSRFGAGWPALNVDWPALRAEQELSYPLRLGARDFTFVHSPEQPSRLVVELRCGTVPRASVTDCYRQLLALNHRNVGEHPFVYALDASTGTVIHSASYLLDTLDIEGLTELVIETARRAMAWQAPVAPKPEVLPGIDLSFPLLTI